MPQQQAKVIKRFFNGDHTTVQPVGPSPALMHVDNLVRLAPVWCAQPAAELREQLSRVARATAATRYLALPNAAARSPSVAASTRLVIAQARAVRRVEARREC